MSYVNNPSGTANGNHYLYYTETPVSTNKTVQSVTLPTTVNQGAIHVFAVGTRAGVYYNNVGTSDDRYPTAGGFDNQQGSYSAQALQAIGITPGQIIYSNGIAYTWPNAPAGNYNNYVANGQTVAVTPVANATRIGFLGASTYAGVSGTATINYTDGTTQTFTLGMSDWLLGSNTVSQPSYGNLFAATTAYVNSPSGRQNYKGYIFSAEVDVQAGKTIQSVTLPVSPSNSFMHIFAIGTRAATAYNNAAISNDTSSALVNADGAYNSYSDQALQSAGITAGQLVTFNGVTFAWPNVPDGQFDNYQASGQVIPVTPIANANTLAFLGFASGGNSSGTATITYTDGSTQTFTLGFTDWANSSISYGNQVVATMSYVNTLGSKRTITVRLFYTDVALQAGKTIQSVTLPTNTGNSLLHVFTTGTK